MDSVDSCVWLGFSQHDIAVFFSSKRGKSSLSLNFQFTECQCLRCYLHQAISSSSFVIYIRPPESPVWCNISIGFLVSSYQISLFCSHSNGLGLVIMTIVPKGFFSEAWNATNDFFEEPKPGLIHDLLGCKDSGMLVYNRCDQLVGELQMSSPKLNDIAYEW